MHSPGINGEGELTGQPANPSSPGKMAVKMVCVCVHVCVEVPLTRKNLSPTILKGFGSTVQYYLFLSRWPNPAHAGFAQRQF